MLYPLVVVKLRQLTFIHQYCFVRKMVHVFIRQLAKLVQVHLLFHVLLRSLSVRHFEELPVVAVV